MTEKVASFICCIATCTAQHMIRPISELSVWGIDEPKQGDDGSTWTGGVWSCSHARDLHANAFRSRGFHLYSVLLNTVNERCCHVDQLSTGDVWSCSRARDLRANAFRFRDSHSWRAPRRNTC